MKTKFSKRILSLFLAVMMVVTSIPMFALTASAGVEGAKYLFAYFTGDSQYGQQIRFALSEDGYNFTALNDNKPVVQQTKGTSETSSGYVRDPYITRDPNGNGFYMLATDMDATPGIGMHKDWNGDSCVYVWHSSDLVNWDQVVNFDFRSFPGFENTIRAWAPQIIWDSAKGQYMMYLSITKDGDWNQMYYTYTSDFQTFTTPVKFEFSDGVKGRIDADIVENNGTYYMYYKDETAAKILVATASSLTGPYTYQADVSSSLSTKAVEGNAMYQIGNSNTWVLLLDEYADHSFAYGTTTDFINFTKYTGSTANNSSLSARHGSVMQITDAEYQKLKSNVYTTDFTYQFNQNYVDANTSDWSWNAGVEDGCGHYYTSQAYLQTIKDGVADFNNGSFFIEDSDARNISMSESFTISFNINKTNDTNICLLAFGHKGQNYLEVLSEGKLRVKQGGSFVETTFTPGATNKIVEYAVSYNGSSTKLYINSQLAAEINGKMDTREYHSDGGYYIGVGWSDCSNKDGYTERFTGTVSSLRFSKYSDYNVALNAAVISTQDAFESKMAEITTSTIYTNIGNAYSAYVDLQKALDAVNYGLRTDVSLSSYIDKLNRAVGSMNKTVNGVVSVNNSNGVNWNSGTITDTNYYSNVLWADTNINKNSDENNAYMITNIMANSSIVLLNDGNKIKYPVGAHIRKQWGTSDSNIKCLTASSTNFYLEANWTGGDKDDNAKNWVTTGTTVVSYSTSNTSYYTLSSSDMMFFRNYMTRNNSENTNTYYDIDTTLSYSLTNKKGKSSSSSIGNNVYTLNYLTLKNLLNSKYTNDVKNAVINVAKDISSYKEGGATNVLSITDCLIDPTAYDYSSNTASVVQEVAGLLKAKTEKLNGLSVTTTATKDSTGYANLRSAIDTAAGRDYSQYTETSVNEYKTILSGARTLMAAVLENGYNIPDPANADSMVLNRIDALNPKLDKTEYNSQMTTKDKSLFTDSVQNYTFDSWKAVRDAINNLAPYKDRDGKYDQSTSTYKYYKSGNPITTLEYSPYLSSTDCTNTFNGLVNTLKALKFESCGDTQNFDAANTVVSSIDRAMYTDSALSAFDTAVANTVASVYHTVTVSEASTYGLNAGTNVILTNQSETDEFTKALLEAVNTLNSAENKDANVNKYSAKVYDEAGNLKETLNEYYGESFVYSLTDSIAEDDVVTWQVTVYANDTDMNKALAGDSSIQPINSQVVSTYNGNTIERTANGSMVITYLVDAGSMADTTTYKVYNAYGNVIDVVYSTEPKDSSYFAENYPNPVLPFYNFVKWNVGTRNANGVVNVKPDFSAIPTKHINVDTSYATVDYSRASAGNAVVGSTVTITGNSANIYGWAVEAGGKYQIVGYGKDYKFNVYADENYVPVLYVDGTYTVNGAQLTADKVAGFSNNSKGNLSDDAYLKAKLDSKAPFVYVQVNNFTYTDGSTNKIKFYIRVTAGSEADNLAYGITVDGRKIASTAKNDGGQFYMATTMDNYNSITNINAFVSYTFGYSYNGTTASITTVDYATVK